MKTDRQKDTTPKKTPPASKHSFGFAGKLAAGLATTALIAAAVALLSSCATIAESVAEYAVELEPSRISCDEDGCRSEYDIAGKTQIHETIRFELELAGAEETLECVATYIELNHLDGSQNRFLWPAPDSDPRCLEAMKKAARQPEDEGGEEGSDEQD